VLGQAPIGRLSPADLVALDGSIRYALGIA
jgi:hypothetical protein